MTGSENDCSFYDKVAARFGGYVTEARYSKEFGSVDPEALFRAELLKASGPDKVALDVGCADGRFTLSIAPSFGKVVAIDLSNGMLESARRLQHERGIDNVSFEWQDARHIKYAGGSFDLVYSRRGPTEYREFFRLLKPGGYFFGIGIGEQDCREIKEIFGRGQDFGGWDECRLAKERQALEVEGFVVTLAESVFYDEYYPSYDDLNLFLQSVPLFEDFDPEGDRAFLEEYVCRFQTDKGIRLPRHRTVIVSSRR